MRSGSFVVHLVGCDYPKPFKHFSLSTIAWALMRCAMVRTKYNRRNAARTDTYAVADTNTLAAIPRDRPSLTALRELHL